MSKFKPNFLLDEQMYFSDAKTTLAYQIREELIDLNKNIKQLSKDLKGGAPADVVPDVDPIEPPKTDELIDPKETVKGK